jgi:hypothetical protein
MIYIWMVVDLSDCRRGQLQKYDVNKLISASMSV